VVAAALCVVALAGAQPVDGSVGSLITHRIATDNVLVGTASTWNPHLPKFVSDGTWEYAVFTRYIGIDGYPYRSAWISKRRVGPGTEWEGEERQITNVHQHPGIALDRAGNLHVVFDCLPDSQCLPGGFGAGSAPRFYDAIFPSQGPGNPTQLGVDHYLKFEQPTAWSNGYIGIGTDPTVNRTFVSLASDTTFQGTYAWDQVLFRADIFNPPLRYSPHQFPPSDVGYAQIPISPTGKRYFIVNELRWDWQTFQPSLPIREPLRSFAYNGFALYTASPGLRLRKKSSISNPDGTNSFVAFEDSSFGPGGRLYVLYNKKPAVNGVCSYLLRETSPGSGTFPRKPLPVGCHDVDYPQLQVDSAGTINILEANGLNLVVSQSRDGGLTWRQYTRTVPISNGVDGVPEGSNGVNNPTLIKPWNSPRGYNPNVLHGMLANWSSSDEDDENGFSWSASEFSIPVGPGSSKKHKCKKSRRHKGKKCSHKKKRK